MFKNIFSVLIVICCPFILCAQSKKEQINILQNSLNSLKNVYLIESQENKLKDSLIDALYIDLQVIENLITGYVTALKELPLNSDDQDSKVSDTNSEGNLTENINDEDINGVYDKKFSKRIRGRGRAKIIVDDSDYFFVENFDETRNLYKSKKKQIIFLQNNIEHLTKILLKEKLYNRDSLINCLNFDILHLKDSLKIYDTLLISKSVGDGRIRLTSPVIDDLTVKNEFKVSLILTIDPQGNVISVKINQAKTTVYDARIINKVISSVKSTVKYNKSSYDNPEKVYLTVYTKIM